MDLHVRTDDGTVSRASDMEEPDSYGREFFSQSPFRSGWFLIAAVVFIVIILGSAAFFAVCWNRIPAGMRVFLLLVVCVRSVNCMWAAIVRHKKLRTMYFPGSVRNIPPGSPITVALDVAARAILDDLFYTNATLLVVLLLVVLTVLYHAK